VASGAYSSIFIASPVLTHWKEREPVYAARRERIEAENDGHVPAYAAASDAVDVEPRARRRALAGRLTSPDDPTQVSAADFEAMKRDLDIDDDAAIARPQRASRSTSTVTPPRPAPAPPPAPAESPAHAPDEPENDGIAAQPAKAQRPKSGAKRRNRRHGRTR
jgi:SecD/SecF fusion protein